MGWLTDDRTYAEVITLKLFNEESDPLKDAVLVATRDSRSISGSVLATSMRNFYTKAEKYRKYCSDNHSYGVPSASYGISYADIATGNSESGTITDGFYPLVPIRENSAFIDGTLETETKRALRRLDIRLREMVNGLSEQNGEANPDLDKLDDCYFNFGLDVYTVQPDSHEYMYNFWEYLYGIQPIDATAHSDSLDDVNNPTYITKGPESNYLKIVENDFNMELNWNYILEHPSLPIDTNFPEKEDYFSWVTTGDSYTLTHEDWGDGGGAPGDYVIPVSSIYTAKRLSATTMKVYAMHGVVHETLVHAGGDETPVRRELSPDYIGLELDDDKNGKSAFFIPIHRPSLELMRKMRRMNVMVDAAQMVLYAYEEVHLSWYESQWFKTLLSFIALVMAVYSFGQSLKASTFLIDLVTNLAWAYAINFVIELILKEIDGTAAIVLAVVAAFLLQKYGKFGSMSDMPFAQELLTMVNSITQPFKVNTQQDADALQEEYLAFMEDAEEQQEMLKEAEDLLNTEGINPLFLITDTEITDPYMSPDEYYELKVHTPNPGVVSLDAIATYVERKLALPEIDTFKHYDLQRIPA